MSEESRNEVPLGEKCSIYIRGSIYNADCDIITGFDSESKARY